MERVSLSLSFKRRTLEREGDSLSFSFKRRTLERSEGDGHGARVVELEETQLALSSGWRDACHWSPLLPPANASIDERLRREIIRYGEFAQACYDGFEYSEGSEFCGDTKFSKEELLQSVGLPSTGYEITAYLYATSQLGLPSFFKRSNSNAQPGDDSWTSDTNWMGFVAVATSDEAIRRLGRCDWRGTVTQLEWIENLKDLLRPTGLDPTDHNTKGVKVETGFLSIYTSPVPGDQAGMSARQQLHSEIKRLVGLYQGEGAENVKTDTGTRNAADLVPKVPGVIVNEDSCDIISLIFHRFPWAYTHVGTEFELSSDISPFLREDGGLTDLHNLEALLHLVDGYQGPSKPFSVSGTRDIALVNKRSDYLKAELGVPAAAVASIRCSSQDLLSFGLAPNASSALCSKLDFDNQGNIVGLPGIF
ncbi:phospholipase A1-Igamma1, chloroplastic-like [Selaginella moellendorffii]|uniref:phospholipase A1-Igamma1, chloroplastic-like n=1 Tax=Selaginella moellendorffii TaxID=88036 RepID=UPI000D1CF07D|nr:phospholipase A1-Igamma1, chloroplastic-like [Selaginella moellendorffii]|eukprot:XP_024527299.1 phospholipase A1-Igamma1, chloroplastic-like [Selaginella moellendorffii]